MSVFSFNFHLDKFFFPALKVMRGQIFFGWFSLHPGCFQPHQGPDPGLSP